MRDRGSRTGMDKRSGFKECPRCGLRNKPTARQCDFCGWEFQQITVVETWDTQVKALEKLGKEAEIPTLDEETSRKIEASIVHKPRDEPEPEVTLQPPPVEPQPAPSPTVEDVVVGEKKEEFIVEEHEPAPKEETPPHEYEDAVIGARFEPVEPTPPVAATDEVIVADSSDVSELRAEEPPYVSQSARPRLPLILVTAGIAVYAVALALYAIGVAGAALGWAIGIAGALIVTVGASFFYDKHPSRFTSEDTLGVGTTMANVVLICPKCNELVREDMSNCPNCGVSFRGAG